MPVRLLVSDASLLIDLVDAGLDGPLFSLPHEFVVPDVLFKEELEERHGHLRALGLREMELDAQGIEEVVRLASVHRQPSRNDLFALVLARSLGCWLLTGDRRLRRVAELHHVEVHGTLWAVGEMVQSRLISPRDAREAFSAMRNAGSRLPWSRVEQLLRVLEEAHGSS